ncbi:hypothetical protein IAT38_007224 [Cryptococcus sp. DSM 104549]
MASFSRAVLTTARTARVARIAQAPRVLRAQALAGPSTPFRRAYATPSGAPSSSVDPTLARAHELLESGTRALEDGDLAEAAKKYRESVETMETSEGYHNLANCEYHLQNKAAAIDAWEKSIKLLPSADAHTNLASAYIFDTPAKPALAIKHLTAALELAPDDPEIAFNLAAILESTGNLEQALTLYRKAQEGGIERAAQNVRNVGSKLLGQKAKEEKPE